MTVGAMGATLGREGGGGVRAVGLGPWCEEPLGPRPRFVGLNASPTRLVSRLRVRVL
jgi:hypothetical protein